MANWCLTEIKILHDNESEIKRLYSLIDEWTNKEYRESGFGKWWLGNIVGNSGIGTIHTGGKSDFRCRGGITDFEANGNQITISTETAWVPMLKMWLAIIDKYLPGAELIYSAEEPGNLLYVTNDPDLDNRFIIDSLVPEIEPRYDLRESDVIKILQNLLKSESSEIAQLLQELRGSKYADDIFVHEWEYVDISEWD